VSKVVALGISHKTAPVALREKVSLNDEQTIQSLTQLLNSEVISEAVAISTCNRTEIYTVTEDPVEAESRILSMLARRAGIGPTELATSIYSLQNCSAAEHLFNVTAGLDAMVLGESEIQGQVKNAYEVALKAGLTGPLTNRLFRAAIETGKRVRSETAIAAGNLSVASVAVSLAKNMIGDLHRRRVVVLGAGETSELVAEALTSQGVGTIFVANRRRDRAIGLAERFDGRAIRFDELPRELLHADIVLASTASPQPIVGPDELETVMQSRSGRPLMLIDIAVPRDIDPDCAKVDNVTLYDIDDLKQTAESNLSVRQTEQSDAERVIAEEIERFGRWLGNLDITPTVKALRQYGEQTVQHVLDENAGRWESLSQRDLDRVEAIARSVSNKLLHHPTLQLKSSDPERRHALIELTRELFMLDESAEQASDKAGQSNSSSSGATVHSLRSRRN